MDMATATAAPRKIIPRTPELPFTTARVPRHWFGAMRVPTMLANGVNLLFPAGERFFVRSVHHYLDQIDDPVLREQIKGFAGQEGRHARAHEDFFALMREQGFQIDGFLSTYTRIAYDTIERISSPALRLAATAAAEHFTALLAEKALQDQLFDHAHPVMQDLLLWHAAEEIEHKAVAFDVLQKVDGRYWLRIAGLAISAVMLTSFWFVATTMLVMQDRKMGPPPHADGVIPFASLPAREGPLATIARGIVSYVHPRFHPDASDNYPLAKEYLSRKGMAVG